MVNFGIILNESARSRAYIQILCKNGVFPKSILYISNAWEPPLEISYAGEFNIRETTGETITKYNLSCVKTNETNINSPIIINILKSFEEDIIVFGGPGGQILKKDILNIGKNFLHAHPGKVPEYRGSTTLYYTILNNHKPNVSVFYLSKEIDEGDLIGIYEYNIIKEINIDYIFDPLIRAQSILKALNKLKQNPDFTKEKQPTSNDLPYFVIHPILKHIAISKTKQ